MKRRLSAVLLALGMSLSVFSMGVYAEETEVTEQVTEAAVEVETETAAETEAAMSEQETLNQALASYCSTVAMWSEEEIEQYMEGTDMTLAAIATNWSSVRSELGNFVEVISAEVNAEGTELKGTVVYDGVEEETTVTVVYTINVDAETATMNWDIAYPKSVLIEQAGLNTLMGLGIVFAALAFLAWLIGMLHIIPDAIEKASKKNAPAEAPKAAPAPVVAAPVVEEEEYVDDLELVAVITAAIAASQNTSSDGFVVRSIKKANKRNWQRA